MQDNVLSLLTFEEVRGLVNNLSRIFSIEELREFAGNPEVLMERFIKSLSPEEIRALPVGELFKSRSTEAEKILSERDTDTLDDLTKWSIAELRLIPGFGKAVLDKIVAGLATKGLHLSDHHYEHISGMSYKLFLPRLSFRAKALLEDELNVRTVGDIVLKVAPSVIEEADGLRSSERTAIIRLINKLNAPSR